MNSFWALVVLVVGGVVIIGGGVVGGVSIVRWGKSLFRPLKIKILSQGYYRYNEQLHAYVICVPEVEIEVRRPVITERPHLVLKAIQSFYPMLPPTLDKRELFKDDIKKDMCFRMFTSHKEDVEEWLQKDSRARIVIGRCKSNWFLIEREIKWGEE